MSQVVDTENIARILRNSWVLKGVIQHTAFVLRRGETYISVNRPAVKTYDSDIKNFVETHPTFYADDNNDKYIRAVLNVGEIRNTQINFNGCNLNINVEVEPRDIFTKSHAGIFTRYENQNLKSGDTLYIQPLETNISADEVLLEVRSRLIDIAKLEYCKL